MAAQVGGRKVDQMGEGSSEPRPAASAGAGDGEATQAFLDQAATQAFLGHETTQAFLDHETTQAFLDHPVTRPRLAYPESPPPRPAREVAPPRPPTEVAPLRRSAEVVRHGPGVPTPLSADQAGLTAERVWRSGGPPAPPRRPRRLRRLIGSAFTVILLVASGVVLYLRFHHAPFHVTGVVISQQTRTACGVDVTGRITTNGSAGTVSYQWLFRPDRQPPRPLNQSVTSGQHAVFVTVAVEGSGHGSASRTVTLQVLGPDPRNASTAVVVSC
jgi:hypothetical protein